MARARSRNRPVDAPLPLGDARVWQALRKPFRWRLFEAVRSSGGISAQALARRVGITPQLMLYHLRLLQAAGLLAHGDGRRARGQGGLFTATRDGIEVRVPARDAKAMRRWRSLARAFEDEAIETDGPAAPSPRWERLTPAETRRIAALFAQVQQVLDGARARRDGDATLPSCTHVLAFGARACGSGRLACAGWRRGR
jgi:predicted ArsR family transcriptional regulator